MGSGRCAHCKAEFQAKLARRQFCSAKCRKAAWTRAKADREADRRDLIRRLAKNEGMTPQDFA